jgi:hypothetical protein
MASSCSAKEAMATRALRPELHISVYDNANVPTKLLAAAEEQVHRIFYQAGVEVLWRNCSEKSEDTQIAGCHAVGSTYLILKILPNAKSELVRDRIDVLGVSLLNEDGVGFYGFVFYDRIRQVAEKRRLTSTLLGHVLAHEIGHLVLRSNSHSISGIMSGRWVSGELQRMSEGSMFFMADESRVMCERLWSVSIKPSPGTDRQSSLRVDGLR